MRIAPRAWNGGPTRCRQTSARRQRQEQARRVQPRERGRHWLCAGAPPFYSQARPFLGQPARAATQRVGSAVSAPASHSIAILTPILVHLARSSGRMRNHFAMVILRRAQIGVDKALHRGSRRTASLTPHFAHQQRGSSPCRLTAASSEAARGTQPAREILYHNLRNVAIQGMHLSYHFPSYMNLMNGEFGFGTRFST